MYVSMKYTKTCDVMINLLKRWKIMMDFAFEGLLEQSNPPQTSDGQPSNVVNLL